MYSSIMKIFCFIMMILFVGVIESRSNPLERTTEIKGADKEMMEVAESQNPFMPRFAMRKFKERRQQARAQRRNNQGHAQRRVPQQWNRVKCPQASYRQI